MAFLRQITTLTRKNIRIVFLRHPLMTIIRALIFPIAFAAFLAFSRNLFVQPATFGIRDPAPIRSIAQAFTASAGDGRDTVAFVNNGLTGGDIDRVIDVLATEVESNGKKVRKLSNLRELGDTCPSSLQGATTCFGGVVFYSSPSEGPGGIWNYTLRGDGYLGTHVDARSNTNSAQLYTMPLQRATDKAIADLEGINFPDTTDEYLYTGKTEEEHQEDIRQLFQQSLSNFMAVTFVIVMIGVCYHMAGHMAMERESGMAELIDAMMPTRYLWQPQVARFISHHAAFTLLYLPGWLLSAAVIWPGVWPETSIVLLLFEFLLSGLAFTSLTIVGASFFKQSQLSGVVTVIAYILLAILAQSLNSPNTATVTVLSLLFTPCNFVWFLTYIARFQKQQVATNLTEAGPESPWTTPGIVLWIFLIIQIFGYPMLGAWIERSLHGTTTKGRNILRDQPAETAPEHTVRLENFTKIYTPSIFRRMFSFISKPKDPVVAVDKLTLNAARGQILALLGANGSGKSTTLDSIAGTTQLTGGNITIDGTGGLGIAPQKNVMWGDLTVEEHIRIFNRLKAPKNTASKAEIRELVERVDLGPKIRALSKTLSGGQKRKLQLGMMLTGGSAVCCVDEVSSGIDPLSRRKIWDILLAERGKRTIILTTHFLDEADLLADNIAILSKGSLRALGSAVELKDRLGAGYRIHVFNARDVKNPPMVEDVSRKVSFDVITYMASSSQLAAQVIRALETAGIHDYKFSGPTIEDVFLQVAEEIRDDAVKEAGSARSTTASQSESDTPLPEDHIGNPTLGPKGVQLIDGKPIGFWRQTWVLLKKRAVVFKYNWFPYVAAFLIPVIAAALVQLYVTDQEPAGCDPPPEPNPSKVYNKQFDNLWLAGGPGASLDPDQLAPLFTPVYGQNATIFFMRNMHLQDTFSQLQDYVFEFRKNVTPAAFWLGDSTTDPTVIYNAQKGDVFTATFGLNALDMLLTNTSIATTFAPFDSLWVPSTGNSLNLLIYFGLALSAMPGFFGLYPTIERRQNVRGLQYSNGVRSFPLWLSHLAFDFSIALVACALSIIIFAVTSDVWFEIGYLFVVLMLYCLTAILYSYAVSLYFSTSLSTYAVSAGIQAFGFLIYLIAYMCIITYAPVTKLEQYQLISHFVISVFIPMGSVTRALFIGLNLFSNACDGKQLANPGSVTFYGGPILYLAIQAFLVFCFLLWHDSGAGASIFRRLVGRKQSATAANDIADREDQGGLHGEATTSSTSGGLQVQNLTKSFKKLTAVDNVSFQVPHSEVYALLGPNGAGKSTTISLIRGDISPSLRTGGDVLVEDASVTRHRAAARSHLGVCPQFDAIDSMTVLEHLRFYAQIRGVPDVEYNVRNVVKAVGLTLFTTRMASALSGGNKRKLSLAIALMGNPSVVLLDEPSSGLDAAAKRIMWRTLADVVPGRSILLTTHSMEEADALANRAGILAKRMLAEGTVDGLRHRFGDRLHVHLISRSAPHSTDAEMDAMRHWVHQTWPGAEIEAKTYHGQMRFSVPASAVFARWTTSSSSPSPSPPSPEEVEQEGGELNDDVRTAQIKPAFLTVNSGTTTASSNTSFTTFVNEERNQQPQKLQGSSSPPPTAVATATTTNSAVGQLIVELEENRERLGIEHYSATPTTLDQVFLTIVGQHNVQEEGYKKEIKNPTWKWLLTGKRYAPSSS